MPNDYRNTDHCPGFERILEKKQLLQTQILGKHPGQEDMYKYVSSNDDPEKNDFLKIYENKCSYCGVTLGIIPKSEFEIDHFIYKKATEFVNEAKAGHMDNIVASCRFCNRKKSSYWVENELRELLHPDGDAVKTVFERDEKYYITIAHRHESNGKIKKYHMKLMLDAEIHRLDFLLMSMIDLKNEHKDDNDVCTALGNAISMLQKKRNIMG